jgi:hypothetical protein
MIDFYEYARIGIIEQEVIWNIYKKYWFISIPLTIFITIIFIRIMSINIKNYSS